MSLLGLLVLLVGVGIVLWAINTFIPMDQKIKTILNVVAVIIVLIALLNAFGVLRMLSGVTVPKVK